MFYLHLYYLFCASRKLWGCKAIAVQRSSCGSCWSSGGTITLGCFTWLCWDCEGSAGACCWCKLSIPSSPNWIGIVDAMKCTWLRDIMVYSWRCIRIFGGFIKMLLCDIDKSFQDCDSFPFSDQQSGPSRLFTPPDGLQCPVLEMHQATDWGPVICWLPVFSYVFYRVLIL
jgi:hypothetical protein